MRFFSIILQNRDNRRYVFFKKNENIENKEQNKSRISI